jgi:pimeloyl-ACP methyl ester carboxylesterase
MLVRRSLFAATAMLAALFVAPPGVAAVGESTPVRHTGTLPNGTTWIADVPAAWNGTLLLYSHGYNPLPANPPQNAPSPAVADALLDRGYALAGSSYSRSGWALGTAADDQLGTLDAVAELIGEPRQVIAVGTSMGGLVTGVLAERAGRKVDGALATCGLMGGGIDLLNYQLDGAHAAAQLLLPGQEVPLVRFGSAAQAAATAQRMVAALDAAQATPLGRARAALVTALFQEPGWVAGEPEPSEGDVEAQQAGRYRNLRGVLPFVLPARYDIEQTSGGNPSWNVGVDYRALLARSGSWPLVSALYRRAGADLRADLSVLTRTADVGPDPGAVRWMSETSVLRGRLAVPTLTLHTTSDSLVPVQHETEYADDVRAARSGALLRQAYVRHAGHCAFTTAELVAAVEVVRQRVSTGRWSATAEPEHLQARAESLGLGPAAYVRFRPPAFTGDRCPPR